MALQGLAWEYGRAVQISYATGGVIIRSPLGFLSEEKITPVYIQNRRKTYKKRQAHRVSFGNFQEVIQVEKESRLLANNTASS